MIDELLHLLSDPAHLAFEAITDLAFAGVGVVWHALWVKRHDAKKHPEKTWEWKQYAPTVTVTGPRAYEAELIRYGDITKHGPRVAVTTELLDEAPPCQCGSCNFVPGDDWL